MSSTAGIIYRLQWQREGWSKTNTSIHLSRRGAFAAAAKLNHATQRYMLKPLVALSVTEGVVHWGADIPLPEDLHEYKQPLAETTDVPMSVETWDPKLQALAKVMLRIAPKDYPDGPTLAQVIAFQTNMEND